MDTDDEEKFAELELRSLPLEIPETNLVVHPVIQRAIEQVGSPFLRR